MNSSAADTATAVPLRRHRLPAVVEVLAAYIALVLGFKLLMNMPALEDLTFFQRRTICALLQLFGIPLTVWALWRRPPEALGLVFGQWRSQARFGLMAGLWLLALASWPIGLMERFGTRYTEWPGALVLVAIHAAVLVLVARAAAARPKPDPGPGTPRNIAAVALLALAAFALVMVLRIFTRQPTLFVHSLVFVGLAEELFFRGYLQGRLNDAFGRDWSFFAIPFGPGLLIAAALFGLAHPLVAAAPPPWPHAAWTAAIGLTLGILREKTGGVLAPAVAHGLYVLPLVFL